MLLPLVPAVRVIPKTKEKSMSVSISNYPSVSERAEALGCALPVGLVFLPEGFENVNSEDEFRFRGEGTTVTKLLRSAGIPITRLGAADHAPAYIHNRSADWALPVIFIGTELIKQSPDLVSLAVSTIQGYVLDLFKGDAGKREVKAEIVVEDRRNKTYKRVQYEGPADGLKELTAAVNKLTRAK